MSKYEICTVLNGALTESEVKTALAKITKTVSHNKDYKEESLGLKDLAYQIENCTKGWYTILYFSSSIPSEIAEFDRQAKLSKDVIRHLIINLDKDYGANPSSNPKRVKKANKQNALYKARIKKLAEEREKMAEVEVAVKNATEESKIESKK